MYIIEITIFILIGYLFAKCTQLEWINAKYILQLVLYIFVTSLIIDSVYKSENLIKNSFDFFCYVLLIGFLLVLLPHLYCKMRKLTGNNAKVLLSTSTLMNCGYIGIPACYLIGGEDYKQYATFFTIIYTPLIIIYSSYLFSNRKDSNIKKFIMDPFLNSFFIGIILIYFSKILNLNFIIAIIHKISLSTPSIMLITTGIVFSTIKETFSFISVEATIARFINGLIVLLIFFSLVDIKISLYRTTLALQTLMPIGILPYLIATNSNEKINGLGFSIILSTIIWLIAGLLFHMV